METELYVLFTIAPGNKDMKNGLLLIYVVCGKKRIAFYVVPKFLRHHKHRKRLMSTNIRKAYHKCGSYLLKRYLCLKNILITSESRFGIFLLSLTYKKRKYCFWVKFSKWRFWWIYTFWSLLNPKITFLAFGLCVCVCVISINQKQITTES